MLKFSLIVPNTRYKIDYLWSIFPSRGLLSLAACLRKNGYPVNYIDADFENLSHKEIIRLLEFFSADVVGITMNTFQAKAGMDLAKVIKQHNSDIKIIIGGSHPSALRNQVLLDYPEIDVACIGESEETVVELAEVIDNNNDLADIAGISYRVKGNVYDNPTRPLIQNLDSIPYPAYDLSGNLDRYPGAQPVLKPPSMHIMASRGCPYNCIFCTKCVWGNSVRFRSSEKVVDEVEFLHDSYGINEIFFQDDTMNVNRKWFFAICDEIIKRGLNREMAFKTPFRVNSKLVDLELLQKAKDAGFHMIFYGVESGNQNVLNIIKKGIKVEEIKRAFVLTHKVGIKTIAAFMIGNIGDTADTVKDSIALAKKIKSEVCGFSIATPLPGTEFYTIAREKGWICSDDFSEWSQFTAVSRNADLTMEEITTLRNFADEQVREYLTREEGGFIMSWISPQFKNKIKTIPAIGPLLVQVWRLIKKRRQRNMPKENLPEKSPAHVSDYAKLSIDEIQRDLDKRYKKGKAYISTTLWDDVRGEELNKQCMDMVSPTDGKQILELGCGIGGSAPHISTCGRYIGTDLSTEAINTASKTFGNRPGFSFVVMDAQDLKFSDCMFDLVIAKEVIEHVSNVKQTLQEAFRVLKPGGNILITSPNRDSLHLRVNRMLGHKDFTCSFDHIRELTYGEAEKLLLEVGFKITNTSGLFLKPYWGIPGVDEHVRHLTDNDPIMVDMLKELGRLCGAKYAFCYVIKAVKP
ncbi:MAG TPA: methyltransferase domain-containing protein [Phycisphaerales bacterium]|nr:methyltransferase domain-containing protein [Phycisphaerales bacterium]